MTRPTEQETTAPGAEPLTAGQLLRAARLKSGMHLAVLSVTLKVPVRQLEALEADQLDTDKAPAFYRALAASMCRHLQTDPAPVLALLPANAQQLTPMRSDPIPAASHRSLRSTGAGGTRGRPSRVVWAAGLMLLLTGALLWLPEPSQWTWWNEVKAVLAQEGSDVPADEPNAPVLGLSSPMTTEVISAPGVPSMPATGQALPSPEVPSLPASSAAQATPTALASAYPAASAAVTAAPASVPASPGASTAGEWVFTAREESWLELRDAQKKVVWSGVLQAGVSTRIASPVPVSVVVGRAPAVSVTWRGQAFDLKPHTAVTVARFEVKE